MSDALRAHVETAQKTAREQISAAWQLEFDRATETLAAAFQQHIGRVLGERFEAFGTGFSAMMAAEREKAVSIAEAKAARDTGGRFNQALRALLSAENAAQWKETLLDAARGWAARLVLFRIEGSNAVLEGTRGVEVDTSAAIALSAAPAIASAVESSETVVAARVASELSPEIVSIAPDSAASRVFLVPIADAGKTIAVLMAEGDVDSNALELLAGMAALTLPRLQSKAKGIVGLAAAATADKASSWAALTKAEQEVHLRAQRFARIKVAEMQLYHAAAVGAGRDGARLYLSLKPQIDAARSAFQEQFLAATPTMVDYLHLELVRTLANEDASMLGANYPGPLR